MVSSITTTVIGSPYKNNGKWNRSWFHHNLSKASGSCWSFSLSSTRAIYLILFYVSCLVLSYNFSSFLSSVPSMVSMNTVSQSQNQQVRFYCLSVWVHSFLPPIFTTKLRWKPSHFFFFCQKIMPLSLFSVSFLHLYQYLNSDIHRKFSTDLNVLQLRTASQDFR